MALTTHGHQIANSLHSSTIGVKVARCGGDGICKQCSIEAGWWRDNYEVVEREKAKMIKAKKYAEVPETLEAVQLMSDNAEDVALWCGGQTVEEIDPQDIRQTYVGVNIPTLDGVLRASEGDYVVRTPAGRFKVIPQEQFEFKYKEVR